ncbi:MAG: PQQ-dependent sugar dehydrogenase [Herpetosiphonaceae bacterium]|nr:PQQ-dependent sugar dehydrogenase [Herpetosiphonaceae bacterium]
MSGRLSRRWLKARLLYLLIPLVALLGWGGGRLLSPASPISFERVELAETRQPGADYTSLALAPDGKLYATTVKGRLVRFPLNADGTTGSPEVITALQAANADPRLIIGLAIDPASTAANVIAWVSHTEDTRQGVPDWRGKISRLSGPGLAHVQDYVIDLPRSVNDHLTNGLAFGPDGALYVVQGSNAAMGAADSGWGERREHLLNAAVLRIDIAAIVQPPLSVKTEDGGSYDPFAQQAPLTIYASGLRNAYDLLWHSNGQLYVPINGSSSGGNTPASPADLQAWESCRRRIDGRPYAAAAVPALLKVKAQPDLLARVVQHGYYGHPNPTRCEWVMNGGNPTGAADPVEVSQYPEGTLPDPNWRGVAYRFNTNYSPDGIIEYQSAAFGGLLQGKILIVGWTRGNIMVLEPGGPDLDIVAAQLDLPSLTKLDHPLDLVENPANGYLYVAEYGRQQITLLRPREQPAMPQPSFSPPDDPGASVFQANGCAGCHATTAQKLVGPGLLGFMAGNGEHAGSLPNGKPINDTNVSEWIRVGGVAIGGQMPGFSSLSEQDMHDLLGYLKSLR